MNLNTILAFGKQGQQMSEMLRDASGLYDSSIGQ
jgi:hypothetical protein